MWAWRPMAPDQLISGHHLSSAKEKEEPGPASCEAAGFEEQSHRVADSVKLHRRMLFLFQRLSSMDRSVLD